MLTSGLVRRRLHDLLSQHVIGQEPLLFLYPSWFAHKTPATLSIRQTFYTSTALRSSGYELEHDRSDGNVKATLGDGSSVPDLHNARPTVRLVRSIRANARADILIQKKKKDLRSHGDGNDWKTPFQWLRRYTRKGADSNVVRTVLLHMPEGINAQYSGDLGELFLEILLTTECHVQLDPRESSADEIGVLMLKGTPLAIALARARLNNALNAIARDDLNASRDMSIYKLWTTNADPKNTTLRSVWSQDHHQRSRQLTRAVEDIPRPEHWTIITFARFVDELVNTKVSRTMQHGLYGGSDVRAGASHHVQAVTRALLNLFQAPQMEPFISSYACVSAFTFLAKHRKFPEVRHIFRILDEHKTLVPPEVFHVLMRAAADAQDLHVYSFILRLMLRRKLQPTWQTWAAFVRLMSAVSTPRTANIIQAMRERGLFVSLAARQAVAEVLASEPYKEWLQTGGTTQGYLDHCDRIWEDPRWLSDSCANRMLDVQVTTGNFEDAELVLNALEGRGRRANVTSLNTILGACTLHGNTQPAVAIMARLLGTNAWIQPDQTTFDSLFRLAWNRRSFNLLRVVWRHACMHGHVSFDMQRLMESTIIKYAVSKGSNDSASDIADASVSRSEQFKSFAAKVAVGLHSTLSLEQLDALLRYGSEQSPYTGEQASEQARLRRKMLQGFVKADMQQVGRMRPVYSLGEMVVKADEMDQSWKREGLRDGIETLLSRAIHVPVMEGPIDSLAGLLVRGEKMDTPTTEA